MRLHSFIDKNFQLLPLSLLEILQSLEAYQHHILTSIFQAAPLDPLDVLFNTQPLFLHFFDLIIDVFTLVLTLIDDNRVFVEMLDL
jgi:hypothetical protein